MRSAVPVLFVVLMSLAGPGASLAGEETLPPHVLRADEVAGRAVPVPAWSAQSPQRLARVDGRLYQKSGDLWLAVVEDRITVRLAEGVRDWKELVARAAGLDAAAFAGLETLVPLRTNKLGIVDLQVPDGSDLVAWCELVEGTGLARYAEVASLGFYQATQTDPMYADQYALNNTGQTGGTPGADVDAERAWDLTAGDPSVIVAVLDSGTDVDHEDLALNIWHNEGEIPANGIDDDGNGYVDDWEGWDFAGNDNDPRSSNYHGTFVMGIVNAAGSNGVGVAGLAGGLGGPGVRGMALAVGSTGPDGAVVDDAILYAVEMGARAITMSLSIGESQAIDDALDYAYNTHDVFIDCAAGNSGSSVGYPALRPEVMAVGSTDHDDASSGFSNPGPEVEVSAPGSNVLSTGLADSYTYSSGTSFAAPYVAGLAGLIYSRNPGLAAADVRQLIIDSAEDVGDPGFDERTGHGRINAFEALSAAANSNGTLALDRAAYACGGAVGVTVSDIDLAGAGPVTVTVSSGSEPAGEPLALTEVGAGSGVFRGTLATAVGAATPGGTLQIAHGDTIVAEYVDADDGAGGLGVTKTAAAQVDCVPPAISGVGATNVGTDSATVVWTTDEASDSRVRYGDATPPDAQQSAAGLAVQHAVQLQGLTECTVYKFEVESADAVGNASLDDDGGSYHVFETLVTLPGIGVVPCHQGQVLLDRASPYGCDAQVGITVLDLDLDTDPGQVESVPVLLTSSSEPAGEWVDLAEINAQSSRFEGLAPLHRGAPAAGDGRLAVGPGDLITATYFDADDGEGGSRVATVHSTADCTAPFIGDLRVTGIAATRALVEWSTDEPATSRVEFGDDAALGSVVEDLTLVTEHSVVISPFDACDRAHFRVVSSDADGEARVADAAGVPFSFNTNLIPGLVWHETFETDTGWQLPDEWERGTPQGLGTHEGDPAAAWSGSFVIGNDLSGQGSRPGDYEPSTASSAISPAFSTRQERDLELIVHRKLGVTSTDEASIHVITSGTDQVWTSNYQVDDPDWWVQTRDISGWADNQSTVQLEFRIESADADTSFGWNIDEIIVKDATLPDYAACNDCSGPPAFAGLTSVVDPDPCGAGGLLLQWQPAPAWGTGTGGTFDVHRGTTPDFVPDASNRIASGLGGTSWTDAGAPVDVPVWYVVRARNDESCGGEGLADDNAVRLGATETTALSLPTPVGATLSVVVVGSAHARLEWVPVAGAQRYAILRGGAPDSSDAVEVGTADGATYEDVDAVIDPATLYYRVVAVDACGRYE
ncbi:MAG: S8 family serine peptidase [Candidatus Eiseniibacteriota bacterium]|jgi:subtilisin family serine protease